MKRFVILSTHFWPERFIINDLALKFKEKNCKFSIITGMPNYPKGEIFNKYKNIKKLHKEYYKGIEVLRIPIYPRKNASSFNLIMNYFSFIFNGIRFLKSHQFENKIERIFVYATSPITACLLGIYLKKKLNCKMIVWVQDLWPESVESTGHIKNLFFLKIISEIVKYIYKNTDLIIAQSNSFKNNIKKYCNKKIYVVENFHWNLKPKSKIKFNNSLKKIINNYFCVTFAGNIGKAQSVITILKAAKKLETYKQIKFLFVGDGSEVIKCKNYINKKNIKNVYFLGSLNSAKTFQILKKSQIQVLTLKKEYIFSLTIPQKFSTYLAVGKPLVISADGEVAQITNKFKVGLTGNAENYNQLAKNILKLYKSKKSKTKKIETNCKKLFKEKFEINNQSKKLLNLIYS